jgi:hypothetical protein
MQTKGVDTLMPTLLNRFNIASADNFEKVGKDWQAYRKSPSGTGPWKMKAWTPRERAELERNTDYWNKERVPKTERLERRLRKYQPHQRSAALSLRVLWPEDALIRSERHLSTRFFFTPKRRTCERCGLRNIMSWSIALR